MAIIGRVDSNSDYAAAKNSPTSPAYTPDLAGHISELEKIHKFVEGNFDTIARPTVLSSHIDEIKIPYIDDDKTNPPENHQENDTMLLVNTHPSPLHSHLEDTSVDFC